MADAPADGSAATTGQREQEAGGGGRHSSSDGGMALAHGSGSGTVAVEHGYHEGNSWEAQEEHANAIAAGVDTFVSRMEEQHKTVTYQDENEADREGQSPTLRMRADDTPEA